MTISPIPPFYIGQEIVAIIDFHLWKKGDEFVVKEQKQSCCRWAVYIGFNVQSNFRILCQSCNTEWNEEYGNKMFFPSTWFVPKLPKYKTIKFSEIKEQELCAN